MSVMFVATHSNTPGPACQYALTHTCAPHIQGGQYSGSVSDTERTTTVFQHQRRSLTKVEAFIYSATLRLCVLRRQQQWRQHNMLKHSSISMCSTCFCDRCFTAPARTAEHNKILLNVQVMPHSSTQCNRCQQSKVQMLSAQVQPYIFLLYAVQSARHKCCAEVHSLMSAFVHVSECACIRAAVILKFGGRWLHSCLQALHAVGAQTSL